jgi:hypothetical protein
VPGHHIQGVQIHLQLSLPPVRRLAGPAVQPEGGQQVGRLRELGRPAVAAVNRVVAARERGKKTRENAGGGVGRQGGGKQGARAQLLADNSHHLVASLQELILHEQHDLLKVHKIEIFFGFDFEICIISLLVMSKY